MEDSKTKMRISALTNFYQSAGRMPSFSELGRLWGLKSKNAVSKAVTKLREMGVLDKDKNGRLIPRSIKAPVKILGTVEAGFPSPAEEELADTISLDEMLIKNREATFMLKVSGDSMSDAGILPGDMVIVDRGATPKSGDIVIAEVDGEWTMKSLRKRGDTAYLVPANRNYKTITPKNKLAIAGVVTAVVRQYR